MTFQYFVVGAGSIGQRHAANLRLLGAKVTLLGWRDIDLVALLRDISKCKGEAGVVIATATCVRMPLIMQCAEVGAALYIEKPIGYRRDALSQIFNLPKATLERSVAGFMLRYHPLVREMLDAPMTNIFRAYFEIGHDVKQWRSNWTFANSYASNLDGGGVLLDLCHEIDLAYLLCGPLPLLSVNSTCHPEFHGVDIASTLDFASNDGRSLRIAMDYLAPTLIRRGSIIGLKNEIGYDLVQGRLSYTSKDEKNTRRYELDRNVMFLNLMSDFVALVEGRDVENPYIPRLDKLQEVSHVIARAWEMRKFTGQLRANLE